MLKKIFNNVRLVAIAGNKNSGKTNNLMFLLQEFRKADNKTPIFAYGIPNEMHKFLKRNKIGEISSLRQLVNKKSCILIIEEFQKLKLNDRRYKDTLNEFVDFMYHNNVYCVLSSPNIREFNSVIGSVIERWVLKSVNLNQCINGSQLKKVVEEYKGRHKVLGSIDLPKDEMLLVNDDEETLLKCDYVEEADTKKNLKLLF